MRYRIVHGDLLLQSHRALLNPFDLISTLADFAKLYQIRQHQNVILLREVREIEKEVSVNRHVTTCF